MKNLSATRRDKYIIPFISFFLLLSAVFFGIPGRCLAEDVLEISNVQFDGGTGKSDEDFIEIFNKSDQEVNLKGYRLAKITTSGKRYSIKSWTSNTPLNGGKKYVWASSKSGFAESIKADASTSETISKENEIVLILGSLEDGTIVDSYTYKEEAGNDEDGFEKNDIADYSGKVIINEVFPAPDTKNGEIKEEFVEILNLTGEKIAFSS